MYTVEKVFRVFDSESKNAIVFQKKDDSYYAISVNKANGSQFEFTLSEIGLTDMFYAIKEMANLM